MRFRGRRQLLRRRRGANSVRAGGERRGLTGWALRGIDSSDLDGLATTASDRAAPAEAPEHPNGIIAIDHVVAISSDLDRTVAALQAAGLDLRRVREEPTPAGAPRQAFFRLGAAILEVVQEPPEATERPGETGRPSSGASPSSPPTSSHRRPPRRGRVSAVRDAVQPGRRIATLRRGAGLSVPVALMSPR